MTARYDKAIRYFVEAKCLAPLRTASSDADTEGILRDHNGVALIQGSSLSGAFRKWIVHHEKDERSVESLFGSQRTSGSLIVSDGVFAADTDSTLRPRLRIDRKTGSAADKGKFDVMHINTGSVFTFTLTWLGTDKSEAENSCIEHMLSALNAGQIRLGAQKSNGFGRVSLRVRRRMFDMRSAEDRMAWLENKEDAEPFELPEVKCTDIVTFTVSGSTEGLLVKSGATSSTGSGSYTPNLTETGNPVIPGSSLKGSVRARAEIVAEVLGLEPEITETVFGKAAMTSSEESLPGMVLFEDAVISGGKKKITRIRINKFTGGVMRGGLFSEEPVCGDVSFHISVPADCPAGCLLIFYALRDLGMGLYSLGSGGSVGRGYIRTDTVTASLPDGTSISVRFNGDGSFTVSDPENLIRKWRAALEVRA